MKRTQVQLDERTYQMLRREAFQRGRSMSSLVRESLALSLGAKPSRRRRSVKEFTFIASGRSRQGRLAPVSERHNAALAEALQKRRAR